MVNHDKTSGRKKKDLSVKYDSQGNIIDFGGWESEEAKLRQNLTWTPEQILQWLEEINRFVKVMGSGERDVLRGNYRETE
ncbi:MAG: hypothetical protein MRK02_04495 [Candidatus Scalindua sp.]|nr:hypothetical protein [Candidatus Scalindua sp.]